MRRGHPGDRGDQPLPCPSALQASLARLDWGQGDTLDHPQRPHVD